MYTDTAASRLVMITGSGSSTVCQRCGWARSVGVAVTVTGRPVIMEPRLPGPEQEADGVRQREHGQPVEQAALVRGQVKTWKLSNRTVFAEWFSTNEMYCAAVVVPVAVKIGAPATYG